MKLMLVAPLLAFLGCACAADAALPAVRLAHVFSDHAVLQRDRPLPVWGWAAPGDQVAVTLAAQKRTATAGGDGRWTVTFDALPASSAAIELAATSGGATAKAVDVLVGEVWVCSGQSNMEMKMGWSGDAEIAAADLPRIRMLTVPNASVGTPAADLPGGTWVVTSPKTVAPMSGAGYFFARELHKALDVPIGMLSSSAGGTPAQSWTSRAGLAGEPTLAFFAKELDQAMSDYPAALLRLEAEKNYKAPKLDDTGWEKAAITGPEWNDMELPQHFEATGLRIDGTLWFARRVEVPADDAGKNLTVSLGPIDDQDTTWWDGMQIGSCEDWSKPRAYSVPAAAATAGTHTIAVRVVDKGGIGGINGQPGQMSLAPAAGGSAIPLAGTWRYRVAHGIPEPSPPIMGPGNNWLPSGLYNGTISPLTPYAIRGVIWYQGEANTTVAWEYRRLFPTLVNDWRAAWKQGDFPFLFVQLASYMPALAEPGESDWAELRDAQLYALRTVANTGMASAIDIGDAENIHPNNKREVGIRLARWALADTYGKTMETSGPLYTGATVEAGRIRVRFDHLDGGLVAKDGPLKRFAIAGEDRTWVWADAAIDGDTVVVSSPRIAKPVAVRYAWASNPAGCNLYNQAGLPASPFRTDDWPLTSIRR